MMIACSLDHVSDADLLAHVRRAVEDERHATARLIALLMELDARRLYLVEGCASLFVYCTRVLHFTEYAAYARIEAARAARKFPVILPRLGDGSLSLTAVGLLAPHLTAENHISLLAEARHKSKRDIEQLVARLRPKPDAVAIVRKLPAPPVKGVPTSDSSTESHDDRIPFSPLAPAPTHRPEVKPLAPERFKIQLTVSRETHDKLRRVQDLLRHSVPNGDLETIFDKAVTLLLEHAERTKLAATSRPRSPGASRTTTRHIPAAVKRAVWKRDGGQCTFKGSQGRFMWRTELCDG